MEQQVSNLPQTGVPVTPHPPLRKGFPFLTVSLSLFAILLLLSTAYLAYQNMQLAKQIMQLKNTPSPILTPIPLPMTNWKKYTTNNNYISFSIPPSFTVKQGDQTIWIDAEGTSPDSLLIQYATIGATLKGPSGAAGGTLTSVDSVNFLGSPLIKMKTVFEGKTTGIFYGGPPYARIKIIPLQFIVSADWGLDSKNGIPKETETLFDQILSTFKFTQ